MYIIIITSGIVSGRVLCDVDSFPSFPLQLFHQTIWPAKLVGQLKLEPCHCLSIPLTARGKYALETQSHIYPACTLGGVSLAGGFLPPSNRQIASGNSRQCCSQQQMQYFLPAGCRVCTSAPCMCCHLPGRFDNGAGGFRCVDDLFFNPGRRRTERRVGAFSHEDFYGKQRGNGGH